MRKVKIQELPKHQDLGIVSNKPRLGLSINPNPYANAFRPKPTALDLRKAADTTTKQRLESNQNAIGQLQFDLGTTSDMSPELRAILSRQLAREQADAAGLKTDWENTQTFKDQKAEQDAIARQNWERRAYGRIEPTFGPIDAAVGLVAGLPALAATGETWAGSALGSAVNTGIGTALQTSPSWAPGLNLGNALWSYGLASSLDRTFDPNSPMRESWRNVYNNPNLENAANALGETAYTGLGFIGANNTLRPGLKLLAEDAVQGFKAGLKPGDPSIVSMGYSLNKPAESTINLERGFRAPRKAKPSREIEEFTDQLSLIGNPNRAKDPSLDYIVSRINPGDRQGIQYKQVRFTEQGKPGDITLKVAKDDEGKPFFYFNANMESPLQAGRAFSKLDEFIPKGWSIQEPHSLSLDSWTTMMRRAKSGKFSFEDAGYLPLNRSAKNRLGNFKDYTLPENVDPMNTYFNKYYFQNPESASDYVMSLQGLIPSELKGFRPTLASEFLPGSTAREYNYIQIPNLRLTKLLRGGDISIPNLRRVKVGGLPKAQEMGEFKPSYDFNISALENMELNRRAKAAGWNSVDEYRNSNWGYGKNIQQAPGRGAAIGVGLDTQLPKPIRLKSPKPITAMPLAVQMDTRSNMPPLDRIFTVARPEQSGVGQFLGNPNAKAAPLNYEEQVNEWLGKPMDKAYDAAERASESGSDPVDNFRHPVAGMYTQQAIKDKVGIPIIGDALGFLGANAMGIGHEAGTIFRDDRPWDVKLREAGEDAFNNFAGSLTGLLPGTQEDKENILYNLSGGNWLPDGVVWDDNQSMYFKDENGNIPRTAPSEMWNRIMDKKQGGAVKRVKINSLPNNWKTT